MKDLDCRKEKVGRAGARKEEARASENGVKGERRVEVFV